MQQAHWHTRCWGNIFLVHGATNAAHETTTTIFVETKFIIAIIFRMWKSLFSVTSIIIFSVGGTEDSRNLMCWLRLLTTRCSHLSKIIKYESRSTFPATWVMARHDLNCSRRTAFTCSRKIRLRKNLGSRTLVTSKRLASDLFWSREHEW